MDVASDRASAWNRRHVSLALGAAGLCVAGLALTWVMAELVPATRLRDAAALHGFIDLGRPWVSALADRLLAVTNPVLSVLFVALLAAVAVGRGRPRVALAIPLVVGGSIGTSELLKPLLAHSHDWMVATSYVTDASWPSGHSAAAMSMALCAVLAAPRRLRPLVAGAGATVTVAIGFSLLTRAWHMPSDVIGGLLVAALWTSMAVAALLAAEQRWPAPRSGRAFVPIGAAGGERTGTLVAAARLALPVLGGSSLVLVVALLGPRAMADFAAGHHSLIVAAAAIAALAGVLVSGLTVGLRR